MSSARRLRVVVLTLAAITCAALFASAAPALAGTASDRPLLFSFDGADTTAGAFTGLTRIGIDQEAGFVYVMDSGHNVIDKFNLDGTAADFSGIGVSSLDGSTTPEGTLSLGGDADISVDNSGGPTQGRIYVNGDGKPVDAFSPTGSYLWQLSSSLFGEDCGTATDTEGHLWVGDFGNGYAVEFANSGAPPAQIGEVVDTVSNACRLNLDASGNVYFAQWPANQGVDKFAGGVFDSNLDPSHSYDVAIDQSNAGGHIFTVHENDFSEFESSGALVGTFGGNGAIAGARGIAYDHALDRVYVTDSASKTVEVFGPKVSGTVPDAVIEPTSDIGVSRAKFSGEVNPQSVPNNYFFEWKKGSGTSWAGAATTAAQSLPEDSNEHAVTFNVTHLSGHSTYQVRLVVENSENHLRVPSAPDTFETAEATAAPEVTIAAPTAITTSTAYVSGTVNPQEDFGASWHLQLSTDPACASGFTDLTLHKLESEAGGPIAVSEELTGLIPNEKYCVRISAENSSGSATSETEEFTTDPVVPDQAFTAFATPRSDTSARLNGWVNPEGATLVHPLTYGFEYSSDGGATWIALPDQRYSGGAREQIVLGEQVTGLDPATAYQFRFHARSEAGPAAPQGQALSFTTRTTAEMNPPKRGDELVNSPDKGTQNARSEIGSNTDHQPSPMSPDGEKVLWSVLGGAPGGSVSAGSTFIAERSASGWKSRPVLPPADQLPGHAEKGGYFLDAFTPDMSTFIFNVGWTALELGRGIASVDSDQHATLLHEYPRSIVGGEDSNLSADGRHFLILSQEEPRQLEDIGSGSPALVSVMPDGLPNSCGLEGERRSFTSRSQSRPDYQQISADGSRVYFSAHPNGGSCEGNRAIFERNREGGETLLVDPALVGSKAPEIIRASPDGQSLYFLTYSQLDPADVNSDVDIYRWDEGTGHSTCLTCVVPDANVNPGRGLSQEFGSVLVSDDSSHIYFESESVLVPGHGKAGDLNVYVLSEGTIKFVADPNGEEGILGLSATEISKSGNVLVFAPTDDEHAHRNLTADEIASECPRVGVIGGTTCRELFRYDDEDGSLECVSCRPDGVTTHSVGSPGLSAAGTDAISADGETVAFATTEALLPADINRDTDIYEWRRGALRLVTDGVTDFQEGVSAPKVLGLSENGHDLLFSVADPGLTGFEQDGLVNFYDARIGGGFEPPSPPVHCSEESCQGPLQPAPASSAPTSSAYSGRGNVAGKAASRCGKGQVRRPGRCVKRHRRLNKDKGRTARHGQGGSR